MLKEHRVLKKLVSFQPLLAGTVPLGIELENSDLDIVCCWQDKDHFIDIVEQHFSTYPQFVLQEKIIGGTTTVIANFWVECFEVELFGQQIPPQEQAAYRHMLIEHKLLLLHGEAFKQQVIHLKQQGHKTEPAFAKLLGLQGDPYEALLLLEQELLKD